MEKFDGCLRELSLNCDLGSHDESNIRDAFIAKMQDGEKQRNLLEEKRTPQKALELEINLELGIQNQLQILGIPACKVSNQLASTFIISFKTSWNNKRTTTNNLTPTICPSCGYTWSPSHCQNRPAGGKI